MEPEEALAILRKGGVPRPFLDCVTHHDADGSWQHWEVCSLGYDNYNVIVLADGASLLNAIANWKRLNPQIIKTRKTTKSL